MKRVFLSVLSLAAMMVTGCARPGEIGWGTVDTWDERNRAIARNWDWEGKQLVDDIDMILQLRPIGHLTQWHLR